MPFRTVAENFHFIREATRTVFVPVDEGAKLVSRLLKDERSRNLFRQAGQYSVSVYEQHFRNLLTAGAITQLDEENAVLNNLSLYNDKTGLSLEVEWGNGDFI